MQHSKPKQKTKVARQKRLLSLLSVALLAALAATALAAGWRFELIPMPEFLAGAQEEQPLAESPAPDGQEGGQPQETALPQESPAPTQSPEETAQPTQDPQQTTQPTAAPIQTTEAAVRILPDLDPAAWNTSQRVEQTLDTGYHNTDFRMVSVPESPAVELDYFNDVAFLGDSITQGLYIYDTGLPNAKFFAYKNSGPDSIVNRTTLKNITGTEEVALDALAASAPKSVYVMLGMNTLRGGGDERYFTYYSQMLDMIREVLGPDVPIYVESMTPTTAETGAERPALSSEYVYNINCLLATLALEKGCYFLNVYDYMLDDTGHMDPAYAAQDGIHMNPTGYARWVECLRTHVVQ